MMAFASNLIEILGMMIFVGVMVSGTIAVWALPVWLIELLIRWLRR